jgi:hypothetical protein
VALADALQFEKVWIFLCVLFEKTSEFVVPIVFVELGFPHIPSGGFKNDTGKSGH